MLSDLSPEEFAAFRAALAYAQALEAQAGGTLGLASPPGRMSHAELGEWFGTSAQDIRLTEAAALEKLRHCPEAYEAFLEISGFNPPL